MRSLRLGIAAAAALLASLAGPHAGVSASPDPRLAQVVARVGAVTITVGDVERRMRAVPRFQLVTFGKTPDEMRRTFVERVLVPEALHSVGARARKIDELPEVQKRTQDALRSARLSALRAEIVTGPGLGPTDVARYYQDNLGKFDSPERLAIWRILCKTRDEAALVIADAKKGSTPQHWNELAREHSIDAATSLRGGNLGFVSPDGASNEAGVKVPPAIVEAVAKARDGEIVAEPVAEGPGFAVVWRRGSMPAVHRKLEDEAPTIRQTLIRQRLEQGLKDTIARLRADKLRDHAPQLVDALDVDAAGQVAPKTRPGVVPRRPVGRPAPTETPRGLR